jgi:hypothetical protein
LTDSLGFEVRFACARLSPNDRRAQHALRFPSSDPTDPNNGLLLEVRPQDGAPWVGFFEGIDPAYELTGCFGWPDPNRVFVMSNGEGYVVNANRPEDWLRLELGPIRGVRRIPAKPYVVVWDFQDLAVYGAVGLLWCLERLSIDDLEITAVTSESVLGRALEPGANRMVEFSVDIRTGRVTGGWGCPLLRIGGADKPI